jgi:hypothetical protein
MASNIKVKYYSYNFAISDQGDIYTWLPLPNLKSKDQYHYYLFPTLVSFKLPSNAQIIAISNSKEKPEILYINSKNEVFGFYLLTNEPSRDKLILPLDGKPIVQIKTTPGLDSMVVLTSDQTTIFYKSNYQFVKNRRETLFKDYEEVTDLRSKFKGKINALAVTHKGYAVVTDNKSLTLIGDLSFYTKHTRSSATKFTFDFNKDVKIKDLFFTERTIEFVHESNEIYYSPEPLELKTIINLSPRYAYKYFAFELSDLNSPSLNQHFIVSSKDQVYLLNKNEEKNTIKPIKITLNPGEKIIMIQSSDLDFQFRTKATAFAWTNQGNLYGFGENDTFQLGVGSRSKDPIQDAILINPYLNKELDRNAFLSLLDDAINKNEDVYSLVKYIPQDLKTNEELIMKLIISSNFNNYLRNDFEINLDLLLKFIAIRPDLKYSFLDFDSHSFIDKTRIASLSTIFPDIVFLYHKTDLPVSTFETYLKPLLIPLKGKPITAKEINQLALKVYTYDFVSSNLSNPLEQLSTNFHLALINLGFQYDFIEYNSLATFVFNEEKGRTYFLCLPQTIREKVQESCEIKELSTKLSMNDLVYDLVSLDLVILSERLIKKGLIPKTKYLQLLAKSPEIFSPKFNSFLLATPKVVKPQKKTEFNFVGIESIHSFENESYFYDGDLLCLVGSEPEGLTNHRFARHRTPFFFHDYFSDATKSKMKMFAANNNSFVVINEQYNLFLGGRILRFLELARPKQGEELVELFDISALIKLNPNEAITNVLMPTEKTVLLLTSKSRIILVYKEDSHLLKPNRKQDKFKGQDITTYLSLKENELIKDIASIDDNHLVYLTNHNNLYLFRQETITKIDVLLHRGEDIVSIKLGELGLLVMTNKGRLWMSEIQIIETYKIQKWNVSKYSSKAPYDLIIEPHPLVLNAINFPLKNDEQILHYDVLYKHAAMVTNHGRVFLWGDYTQGAFGSRRFKFTHILDLTFLKKEEKVVKVYVGFQKTYLITDKNRLFALGANLNGSLGDGTEVNRFEPTDITNKFKR